MLTKGGRHAAFRGGILLAAATVAGEVAFDSWFAMYMATSSFKIPEWSPIRRLSDQDVVDLLDRNIASIDHKIFTIDRSIREIDDHSTAALTHKDVG